MITLQNVEMDLGTRMLFKNVSFLLQRGDRVGLVGRNGAGKSTMLGVIHGDRTATGGEIHKQNNIRIGLLSQDLTVDVGLSLRETATHAFDEVLLIQARIDELHKEIDSRTDYDSDDYMATVQRLTDAHEQFERRGGFTMHASIERVLTGLGFEAQDLDKPLTSFSGGWQMRAELGKLLLSKPDALLLDEPTNHLDIESVQWLEEFLREYEGVVVLVSHDRTFLDNVTNRTIEITPLRVYDVPAAYSDYEQLRDERLEQQRAASVRQARERAHAQKFIDRFRYKSSLASRVQSRIKQLQKIELVEVDTLDTASMHFHFPPAPRSGRVVVECTNVVKDYGAKHVLKGVDFVLERGEKVAFLGKNGEGKSTLSKIIIQQESVTRGEVKHGYGVSFGYYAQQQADLLAGQHTVLESLEKAAPPEMRARVRSLLGAFLFSGDDVNKRVSVLSGGEKSRLALARLLLQPVNLLVLDEPTNHLDMLSKEVLKQALMEYDGAMIVVSHDRDFLDGLTDRVIIFKHGKTREVIGDYEDAYRSVTTIESSNSTINGNATINDGSSPFPSSSSVTNSTSNTASTSAGNGNSSPRHTSDALSREEQKARARERKKLEQRVVDIERQITVQEKTIAECETALADPDLYKDPVLQHKTTTRYETARTLLSSLMAEWETVQETLEKESS
ncbi:MAG: ABC-F family ATP-binding cassette domain-containing protein [Bradyrhizobiaceae bacterium]|nr:ABC-F family ATP-binding cassette domain-containing protein [Bradyrhizobiaceae bacterium]